jgi:peroxiredoxin
VLSVIALFVDVDFTKKGTARPMNKITAQFLAILLGLISLTTVGASSVTIGEQAPDFSLRSLDGGNLRLSEYRSEVVVLNFWATWCGKCSDAMPILNSLYQQYQGDGLQVFAVGVDGDSHKALEFAESAGVSFPMLTDNENKTVSRIYDLGSMPLTLVIDREGNVRHVHKGFKKGSGAQIAAEVAELLAE